MRRTLLFLCSCMLVACSSVVSPQDVPLSRSVVERIEESPRHQEWVEVKRGDKTIYTWVVYPQVSEKRRSFSSTKTAV